MASEVEICNRALQKLGAKRIVALTDDTVNARACNAAYEIIRDKELRAHPWSFAMTRAQLAADAAAPAWGKARAFQLPTDCLRVMDTYPEFLTNDLDWEIEGRKIYTNDAAPLNVRYVYRVTDPNEMDVLFRELLATSLALEMCEELTQSNSKILNLSTMYKQIISEARRTNAIEKNAAVPPEDFWVTVRN